MCCTTQVQTNGEKLGVVHFFTQGLFGLSAHALSAKDQGPSRKQVKKSSNPEQADIYIVPLKDHKPGSPLMQSDVKVYKFQIADRESTLLEIRCLKHTKSGVLLLYLLAHLIWCLWHAWRSVFITPYNGVLYTLM